MLCRVLGSTQRRSLQACRKDSLKMRTLLFPGNHTDVDVSETPFFQELMQLHFAKSKPMVCIEVARLFEPVAQQVENHHAAAAFQNPPRRSDGSLWMNGVMQSLTENRKIDAVFGDWRLFNVTQPVLKILESMLLRKLRAELDHFWRIIDRDHFAGPFCQ